MRGTAIVQVVFEEQERNAFGHEDDPVAEGGGLGLGLAVLGVCGAAIALALLPAVTAITVLLGTTLPLRFELHIGLAGLIGLKLLAAGWGIAQAAPASHAVGIASAEAG